MTALAPRDDLETLIAQLDTARSYGTRTYDEVCEAVRAGVLEIKPAPEGSTQPLLVDGKTHRFVKGSGQSHGFSGMMQRISALAREQLLEDWPEWYRMICEVRDDPSNPMARVKAAELMFKYTIPVPRAPVSDTVAAGLMALLEQFQNQTEERVIEVEAH